MAKPQPSAKLKREETVSEYVSGGYSYYDTRHYFGLGDPLQQNLTQQEIERMRRDDEISSSVEFLVDSIFADGLQIVPSVPADDPEIEKAQEIADFCGKAIESARKNFVFTLRQQFRAAYYYGMKVGEIVLVYADDAKFVNRLILDRVNLKPLEATAFVTDEFDNVLGIVAALDSRKTILRKATDLTQDEVIEREKFQILSFEHDDNSPLGITQVKSTYESFCDKRVTRAQYKQWREKNAATQKFLTTAPNAKEKVATDENNQPIMENNKPKVLNPQKELMKAAANMENHSILVAEHGVTCVQMEIYGSGEQFERSFKINNNGIRKSILGDALATGAADKDAKAARQSSMNVVDLRVKSYRNMICLSVKRDLLTLLTTVNFDEKYWHLVPDASLGDTERRDWATDLNAATAAGYVLAKKHYPELDKQFSLDPRDDDDETMQPDPQIDPNAGNINKNSDGDGKTDPDKNSDEGGDE